MPSRVIRGEINASRSLSRVSLEADLTFRALLVAVDDWGRTDADPQMLKALLFPRREKITPKQIRGWIDELATEGCLQVYRANDGLEYIAFPRWEEHRGKSRRGAASRFPAPPRIPEDPRGSPRIPENEHASVGVGGGGGGGDAPEAVSEPEPETGISLEAVRALPDEFIGELSEARRDLPEKLRALPAIRAWLEQSAPAMRDYGKRNLRRTARAWWRRARAAEVLEAINRQAKIELRSSNSTKPSDAEARASPAPPEVTAAVLSMTRRIGRKPE